MAYMRGLCTRRELIRRQYSPSLSYILNEDREGKSNNEGLSQEGRTTSFQWRSFGSCVNNLVAFGLAQNKRCVDFPYSSNIGASFCRHMSSTVGGSPDKIELMSDIADVLSDSTVVDVATKVPAVDEVAAAAADSFFPVAVLQHFIDAVHSFTGLNWWASIVLTTILIRTLVLPFQINQLKASSKLALMRPRLEEIKQEVQEKDMDPMAVAEGQKRMQALFREYGVSPLTPLKGLLIQGPIFISFFVAVSNMAEKVPSFKSGGAFWFLDLTTPDSLYILPVLAALTFFATVESNVEGMEGNPAAGSMKKISRIFAVVSVPLTMGFPKAIFCYWITSNLFSLAYGLVLKNPGLRKSLGVPDVPEPPQNNAQKPPLDMLSALKQAAAARQQASSSLPGKPFDLRISTSSIISQRLRSLEKQVKARKKNSKT